MKIEDALTTIRIILSPVVMALIFANELVAAFWIYGVAALTDAFDGYFARKRKKPSPSGELLDTLADYSLLYMTIFAIALTRGWLWPFILIAVSVVCIIYVVGRLSIKAKKISTPHLTSAKVFGVAVYPTMMAYIINWEHAPTLLVISLILAVAMGIDYLEYIQKQKSL